MTTHSKKNKKNKKTISITDSALVLSPANTSFEEIPTPTATEIHTQPLSTEEMLKNSTDKVPVVPISLSDQNAVEKFSETTEYFLTALATGEKPWFLTSAAVFTYVKTIVASIPKNKEILETGLSAIEHISVYLNGMTSSKTVVITAENCHDLIDSLDTQLSQLLIRLDDGFDDKRGKLSSLLRQLIAAIIKHKEVAVEYVQDKAQALSTEFVTRSEKMMQLMSDLLLEVQTKGLYPVTCDKVAIGYTAVQTASTEAVSYIAVREENLRSGIQGYISTQAYGWGTCLLTTVQPYVQNAVIVGQPLVDKAITMGQPYALATINKAQPYLEQAKAKAKESPFVATQIEKFEPFMTQTIESAKVVLEEVKTYAGVPVEEALTAVAVPAM